MSQTKRNPAIRVQIGERLRALVEVHLALSWVEAATLMQYANSSTLLAASHGRTSLSVEKLAALARYESARGRANIDWLLTGIGNPLLSADESSGPRAGTLWAKILAAPRPVRDRVEAFLDVQAASHDDPVAAR